MSENRTVLCFFLLFMGVLVHTILLSPLRNAQARLTAAHSLVQSSQKQELEQTRCELKRAMNLIEKCFGRQVDLNEIKSIPVTITAYSSTEAQCDSTPYITASESPVRVGTLAVSTDLVKERGLSFGEIVLIPGYGLFEVRDLMNPRWRRRVDIWESDVQAAKLFGKQKGTLIWVSEKDEHPKIATSQAAQ